MATQIIADAVAGPFRAEFQPPGEESPLHLGVIGERGIRQIRKFEGEDFSGDLLGSSIIESVYLGGQYFLEFELEEADLEGVAYLINPYTKVVTQAAKLDPSNEVGVPGTFATSYAGPLTLTPLYSSSGSKHTTAGEQTTPVRTYGLATLASGFERETLLSSKRRVIPVRMRCYPYSVGQSPTSYVWYEVSALGSTYYIE